MTSPAPSFPPLLWGRATGGAAPMDVAVEQARAGCDAGLVLHDVAVDRLRAALVLAPEVPLSAAMAMLPLCAVGLRDALGALAPPEVAVHLAWDGGVLVNGALCGTVTSASDTDDPQVRPDWLVVALDVAILPTGTADPGETVDRTTLADEGCGDIAPVTLLEAWIRHSLVRIHAWEEGGPAPVAAEWSTLAHGIGAPVAHGGVAGTALGIDDALGLLVRTGDGVATVPLSALLRREEVSA